MIYFIIKTLPNSVFGSLTVFRPSQWTSYALARVVYVCVCQYSAVYASDDYGVLPVVR